tara:strand:+ start:2014 stop:2607 length:594 start_codon:yes stop_codon:yes gene_type:complete
MKKYIGVALIIVLCAFTLTMKLKKIKAGDVSMQVPDAFEEVDEQTRRGEYSGKNAPIAVYRSPRDKSAITIYHTADSVRAKTIKYQKQKGATLKFDRDLEMEYAFKKSSFSGKFKELNFIQDGIANVNGKDFIFFEFDGVIEATDRMGRQSLTKVYNYMLYTYVKEDIYSINFICKGDLKEDYQKTIQEVMKTVKIK